MNTSRCISAAWAFALSILLYLFWRNFRIRIKRNALRINRLRRTAVPRIATKIRKISFLQTLSRGSLQIFVNYSTRQGVRTFRKPQTHFSATRTDMSKILIIDTVLNKKSDFCSIRIVYWIKNAISQRIHTVIFPRTWHTNVAFLRCLIP